MSSSKAVALVKKSIRVLQDELLRSWWVILFALFCLMCYEQGVKKREADFVMLTDQLQQLQEQKQKAFALKRKLLLQINSESDPAWIELTLMRELGLSPKGSVKVLFTNDEIKE